MFSRNEDTTGRVFNIQKYSLHDGPGIRTTVFLKGCPLSCAWCSNPESQSFDVELMVNTGRCLGINRCGQCLDACDEGAAISGPGDTVRIDRDRCRVCDRCATACPSGALSICGTTKSAKEVVTDVEKDSLFYTRSGGGMTLGGGEPLSQPDFALALLKQAARKRIGTAVETCGQVPFAVLAEACRWIRYLIYDIKTMDGEKHRRYTGRDNRIILDNLRRIRKRFPALPIHVRTPVVPDFNDRKTEIEAILTFINGFANVTYELLPFHSMGRHKYDSLGRVYDYADLTLPEAGFRRLKESVNMP